MVLICTIMATFINKFFYFKKVYNVSLLKQTCIFRAKKTKDVLGKADKDLNVSTSYSAGYQHIYMYKIIV